MPWEFKEANMKKDWNNRWSLPAARSLAAAATPLHSAGPRALTQQPSLASPTHVKA
uniref:Uncharacterized protein n=1 Tax=Oryza glumipatula TaxID=40148 RepID=A0A0D9YWC6_9ORYZ